MMLECCFICEGSWGIEQAGKTRCLPLFGRRSRAVAGSNVFCLPHGWHSLPACNTALTKINVGSMILSQGASSLAAVKRQIRDKTTLHWMRADGTSQVRNFADFGTRYPRNRSTLRNGLGFLGDVFRFRITAEIIDSIQTTFPSKTQYPEKKQSSQICQNVFNIIIIRNIWRK